MRRLKTNDNMNVFQFVKSGANLLPSNLFIKMPPLDDIKAELRFAVKYLSEHRLLESAKWCSELLSSVLEVDDQTPPSVVTYIANNTDPNYRSNVIGRLIGVDNIELEDGLLQVKTYFDLREFKKAAFFADKYLIKFPGSQQLLFFKVYSIYMHEKMQRDEEVFDKPTVDR
jgi:hypothetical protein